MFLYTGGNDSPLERSCRQKLTTETVRVSLDESPGVVVWAPETVVEACNGQRPAEDRSEDTPLAALSAIPPKLLKYVSTLRRALVRGGRGRYLLVVWDPATVEIRAGLVAITYNGRKHLGSMVREGVWRPGDSLTQAYRDADIAPDVYVDFHKIELNQQQERKNGIVFQLANAFGIVDPHTQYRQLKVDFLIEAMLFTSALKYQGRNLYYLCTPERNILPTSPSLWLVSPAIQQEQHANQASRKGAPATTSAAVQAWFDECPLGASARAELHRQLVRTAADYPLSADMEQQAMSIEQRLATESAWRVLAHYASKTSLA